MNTKTALIAALSFSIGLGIGGYREKAQEVKQDIETKIESIQKEISSVFISKPTKFRSIRDIQSFLGVEDDGMIGPQTIYPLHTLLLDVEKKTGFTFTAPKLIDKDFLYRLNQIIPDKIESRSIESLARHHFKEYILYDQYKESHPDVLISELDAANYLHFPVESLDDALYLFTATMNYEHNISMPISGRLLPSTVLGLNYAKSIGLTPLSSNSTLCERKVKTQFRSYDLKIPSQVNTDKNNHFESDPVMRMVSAIVCDGAFTKEDQAKRLLRFVNTFDYYKSYSTQRTHPAITIANGGGSQMDGSILYMALLGSRGINSVFIDANTVEVGCIISNDVIDYNGNKLSRVHIGK